MFLELTGTRGPDRAQDGATMTTARWLLLALVTAFVAPANLAAEDQISDWTGTTVRLKEGDVMSSGVKIHYHTVGDGPLLIMIHGVGGFWFDWRQQIPTLSKHYKVVIMTQRGFNLSDKPAGVEQYAVAKIAGDIDALIQHFGAQKATLMAYDSGGFYAWYFAMHFPEKVDRFVTFGSYHPATVVREFTNNPRQQKNAQYARDYQEQPDAPEKMAKTRLDPNAPMLPRDTPEIHRMRLEAYKRSSFEAMINFYKANWPRAPYSMTMNVVGGNLSNYPKVTVPVLVVFGREDSPVVVEGLNDLWKWVDQELTLIVVPGAGHNPQWEVPDFTTPRVLDWLEARKHPALKYPR